MFLDRLLNQGSSPVLEQLLRFTDARQRLLGEDIVNASTPNFIQKDLSPEIQHPQRGMLFHDGNNRSMDQLMSEQAKNALMHSMAVELLRQQYTTMEMALRERVS